MANRSCTPATERCAFASLHLHVRHLLSCVCKLTLSQAPSPLVHPPPFLLHGWFSWGFAPYTRNFEWNCFASLSGCVGRCAQAYCAQACSASSEAFTLFSHASYLVRCSHTISVLLLILLSVCHHHCCVTRRASSSSLWLWSVRSGSLTHCVTSMTHSQSHK